MARDEARHDLGHPDSPIDANAHPPPGRDTSDTTDPSDNEPVPEVSPLDAIDNAEASRSDQIVVLVASPRASDALGRRVPVSLSVTAPDTVEVRFGPVLAAAFPLTATSQLTSNPDALP